MSKLDKILDKDKKQKILTIYAKYGGYNVRIFGSYARGEATKRLSSELRTKFISCQNQGF